MSKKETGRIVRSLSGFYDVRTPDGTVTCRARGILRKQGCTPLTGDLVEITLLQEGPSPGRQGRDPVRSRRLHL